MTVNLLDGVGATVASMVTAGGGVYRSPVWCRVITGSSSWSPLAYVVSLADQGATMLSIPDANPISGLTPLTTLVAAESELTLDAGMYELASIGDFVWLDSDADGVQDGGEVGLDGVT